MSATEVVKAFIAAVNANDLDRAGEYLSEDFRFSGPVPQPLDKPLFLKLIRAQKLAFPSWSLFIRIVQEQGERVIARVRVTGQPTSELLITVGDASNRPGVGDLLAAPEEHHEYTLRGGRIAALQVRPNRVGVLTRFSVN